MKIQCKNIKKSFKTEKVFEGFSFEITEPGLYILFGESGSGKTTLLNMIAGIEETDNGTILVNEQKVKKANFLPEDIAYIAQDAFYVNYLNVWDNLLLCSTNKKQIEELLKKFSLWDKRKKYPQFLSGGERQRMALIQAILQEKDIMLMDEPTSALDEKNKNQIFQLLNQIKKDKIIICACHDTDILQYATAVIDLNKNCIERREIQQEQGRDKTPDLGTRTQKRKTLFPILCKQGRYRYREKKSSRIMMLVFLIVLGIISFCSDYKGKIQMSLLNQYKVNSLEILLSEKYLNDDKFYKDNHITDHQFQYDSNQPEIEAEDGMVIQEDYETSLRILPEEKEEFPYTDDIMYGSYYTDTNQVILGYKMAEEMSSDIKSLIGQKVTYRLPDRNYDFEIVGILKNNDDKLRTYLRASGYMDEGDHGIYVNSKFMDRYFKTKELIGNYCGKTMVRCYFENLKDLQNFLHKYGSKDFYRDEIVGINPIQNFVEYSVMVTSLGEYLYPVTNIMICLATVLYFILRRLELIHNQGNFCVYQYYGYPLWKVKLATIFYNGYDVAKKYIISLAMMEVVMVVVNQLNQKYAFLQFDIFSWDFKRTEELGIFLILSAIVLSFIMFCGMKVNGWFQILKKKRDIM